MKRLAILVLLLFSSLPGAGTGAKTDGAPDVYSIRVESHHVLVPAFVFDKRKRTSFGWRVGWTPCPAIDSAAPQESSMPNTALCRNDLIFGLTPKDFHLFEDDKEQRIQSVSVEAVPQVGVRDNVGAFIESSNIPKSRWSTAEISGTSGSVYRDLFYLIDYVPPDATPGKCHQIKVKVGRSHSYLYARSQYCNTEVAPSDPLGGTQLGKELAADLASTQAGKIELSFQTGVFYTTTGNARVEVALEFPYDSLKRKRDADGLVATIGIIGEAYSTDGSPVESFSDLGCCPASHPKLSLDTGLVEFRDSITDEYLQTPEVGPSEMSLPKGRDVAFLPAGYQTQMNLAAGQYELKVALSDGSNFGRMETPLSVDAYDTTHLSLSSVMLCKRFRDAVAASQSAAAVKLSPEFVPLVSKGMEFTPAGDTRFKKGEALFAYFEVYEPQPAAPATGVQTRLRVSDAKTGEVKIDTGLENVDASTQPGSMVIPIAKQVAVDKLPAGSYRLEVQATDPVCECTVWRAANFTIE